MSKKKAKTEGKQINDAFSNQLYKLGWGSQSPIEATTHPQTRLTNNYALMDSLYRGNWVVQNIIDTVPADMLREWHTISGGLSADELEEIKTAEKRARLKESVFGGLKWGRLYGGAVGVVVIKGQEDMLSEPLEIESVLHGSFAGLMILDRWSGVTAGAETVKETTSAEFGTPEYYTISGSGRMVHCSRVIRFIGRELPYLEKIQEQYWGESEIEAIYSDICNHENVVANMANLTFRANESTIEVQNLDQLFSIGGMEQQKRFWSVMQNQAVLRSNFGIQLVNKGDRIYTQSYSFAGLESVYDAMCQNLSGATHIPMTKLFGRSPGGLNATGESDMRNYYDYIDGLRETHLRPVLEKLFPIVAMSALGYVPEKVEIDFPPLWSPSAIELADTNAKTVDTIIKAFQAGLIDLSVAKSELKKAEGLFDAIEENDIKNGVGVTYQDVTALRDPMSGI